MSVLPGTLVQATARFKDAQGNDNINVFHFRCDFDVPQTDSGTFDCVDEYVSSVYEEFDTNLDDDFEPYDLKVDAVEFLDGKWEVVQNIGAGAWGGTIDTSAATDPLPTGVALLAKLYTSLGKHTGRKFFGGFVEAANNEFARFGPSVRTQVLTGVTKLLTPYVVAVGSSLASIILDRADGTVRDIIAVAVSETPAYQRRRREGTGS